MQERIDQNLQKDRNLKSYDNFKKQKKYIINKKFHFLFYDLNSVSPGE